MPADKFRHMLDTFGGNCVLTKYKCLLEGMAPGISPPPAVYGVPTATYTYVLGDATLAMHGAKKSKKGGYPTAQDETTLRWSRGECRSEYIVKSFSGADPAILLEQLKLRWKLILTYDVLFIVSKFNGAVEWVKG